MSTKLMGAVLALFVVATLPAHADCRAGQADPNWTNANGGCKDANGLTWSVDGYKMGLPSPDWTTANNWCTGLIQGNVGSATTYSDWRLPSVDEYHAAGDHGAGNAIDSTANPPDNVLRWTATHPKKGKKD